VHSYSFGKGTCNVDELAIKESTEMMKFSRSNLRRSIGKKWASTLDDFTETNQTGIFGHIVHLLSDPDTGSK
jgi:hypothetical protein